MISIVSRPLESILKSQVPMGICTPLPLPGEAPGPKIQIDAVREKKKMDLIFDLGSIDFDFSDLGRQSKDEVFFNGIPGEVVVTFVETIEKAYHYFYFKDYLTRNSDKIQYSSIPDNILATLSRTQGLEAVFGKIDKVDLSYILEKHISKLKKYHEVDLIHQYAAYLATCEFITPESKFAQDLEEIIQSGVFSTLSYDTRVEFLREYKLHIFLMPSSIEGVGVIGATFEPSMCQAFVDMGFCPSLRLSDREEPEEAFIDPIYKMVFDSLKGVSTLDLNPGVELERIKRSHPGFYADHLVYRMPPLRSSFVPSMAVLVMNLPSDVNKKAVEEFFSDCGDTTVEIRRRSDSKNLSEPRAACVTFSTTDGHAKALLKHGQKFENNVVRITPVRGSSMLMPNVKTREIGAAEDVICVMREGSRNVELFILHQVLEKYWLYSEKRL